MIGTSKIKSGFTLLELLVVLIIISSFSALVLPRFISQSVAASKRACYADFATLVGAARFRAVEKKRVQQLVIDLDKNNISLVDFSGKLLQRKCLLEAIEIEELLTDGRKFRYGSVVLKFWPDGSSSKATIAMLVKQKETLYIEIDGINGSVKMS